MKMNAIRHFYPVIILGLISFCHLHSVLAAPLAVSVIGDAFDIKNKTLLYQEVHCGTEDDLAHEVFYRDADGELLAQKILSYKTSQFAPSFVQQNLHTDETISVQYENNKVTMSVQNLPTKNTEKSNSETVNPDLPLVIDAGFDVFVRQHWDSLVSGDRKWFRFPVASRSSLIAFRVESSTCRYDNDNDQCFRLELSNWLYRMLADPIELGYDPVHKRLTRYRGLSNIEDDKRTGQIVDIHYRYDASDAFTCDAKKPSASLTG